MTDTVVIPTGTSVIEGGFREINPETGMQKGYLVLDSNPALSDEEREAGFVRPLRFSYVHRKCMGTTRIGDRIAETYARDPFFYSDTFCAHCKTHFSVGPNGEFDWIGENGLSTEKVGA